MQEEINLERPQDLQQENAGEMNQIIVFKLGDEEYGLFIDQIKEVVLTPKISKIPLTPKFIKGVANIRGNILAIIDLEEKFALKTDSDIPQEEKSNYTLVVESKEYNMAILVKEVPNTLSVATADIDYTPNIINDSTQEHQYINGVIKLENRLIILIDLFKVISKEDISSTMSKA
ncbi:chemotaxis protein CheW [Sediminitomix flava]|uniref:Purine-binding chemotaxis protein CheW n=1 Tax=Sediminitomix flava TaxID=379075 RepID=A0A315ZUS3_SEDFL|nr:chemotaxis protein CheW [Sediminitomix flava]PWJ39399.1 purine-binding chemotaxis protein CheW [Sediminitomix flava]